MTREEMRAFLGMILDKVRDHWCKGVFALDRKGRQVESTSREAVRWCLAGALRASMPIEYESEVWGALMATSLKMFPASEGKLVLINDSLGQAVVVEVVERTLQDFSD